MRSQLTRVELLARKGGTDWLPELFTLVESLYPEPGYLERVQGFVREKSGEKLPLSTISSFVQRRYVAERFSARKAVKILQDLKGALGDAFQGEHAEAILLEKLTEAMKSGKQVGLEFALRESRLWAAEKSKAK